MKETIHTIEVAGRGAFPYDMLRFGCCWPSTTTDASNIEPDAIGKRTIRLDVYGNVVHLDHTLLRFRSFLWAAKAVHL